MTDVTTAATTVFQSGMKPSEQYLLVPFDRAGTHVLLRRESSHICLLALEIPRFTRLVEELTSRLLDQYGFTAIILWSQPNGETDTFYAVLEVCEGERPVPSKLAWIALEDVASHVGEADARFIYASHKKTMHRPVGADPFPFSRLGWIYEIRDWVHGIMGLSGITIEQCFHVSGGESTSLVRFEGFQPPLWLKAVGNCDVQEFANTQTLSRLLPKYLPRILAVDPLLNAWLMESGGEPLRSYQEVHKWKVVAQRLAGMQVDSESLIPELLDAGLRDLRFDTLSGVLAEFFDVMADLMGQQTKPSPAPLSAQELCVIASTLEDAIGELSHLGIPDALGHHDFNPGNILIDGECCVFTDWSAGHVGCPLFTFEYLLAHFRKSLPPLAAHDEDLREAYARCWLPTIRTESIGRALWLSPLVAVYASAIASGSWKDPERLARPGAPGYLRSLARIMKREIETLNQRREPCLNY
jgi:hypothetical protein